MPAWGTVKSTSSIFSSNKTWIIHSFDPPTSSGTEIFPAKALRIAFFSGLFDIILPSCWTMTSELTSFILTIILPTYVDQMVSIGNDYQFDKPYDMFQRKWFLSSMWSGTSSHDDSMAGWHGGRLLGLHTDTPFLFVLVRFETRIRPLELQVCFQLIFNPSLKGHFGFKSILAANFVSPFLLFWSFKSKITYLLTSFGCSHTVPWWKWLQREICLVTYWRRPSIFG